VENVILKFNFKVPTKRLLVTGCLVGIFCFVWSFLDSPQRAWTNYLVDFFYFISLALGGGFILALTAVANAAWATPYKRLLEALTKFLPYGLLLGIGLFFGIHTLYEWSHPEIVANDEILQGKSVYLNVGFFMGRMFFFIFIWWALTKIITSLSLKQDENPQVSLQAKMTKWGAIFLIVFAFTYSFASFDWLMSVRPHWFSTIYGIYTFSGLFVNVLAVVTLMLIWMQGKGYYKDVINENHYHDLGKFIFGFTTFWAYIWISQYLLIWYANIPEETGYFITRELHAWDWLFFFNLAINWLIPFLALMTRKAKRSTFILGRVCILLIIGRWLDIYLMVAPDIYHHAGINNPQIGIPEIGMAIGMASLFILVVGRALSKTPLIPKNDTFLKEGLNLHQ